MHQFINKIKNTRNMAHIFIACTAIGLSLTALSLFISHGESFNEIFHVDSFDTGMDFFHSIEYTRGRAPYELYETLYPPLANLFFYVLSRFVPYSQQATWADTFQGGVDARGTLADQRLWQPSMLLFMAFIIAASLLLFLLIQKLSEKTHCATALGLCFLVSYGVLFALERGNIIILCAICCLFFVFYKDSSNKWLSELSLVALAVAAGLKLYPAVFGLLLLYDKQYKKAFRAIIYGVVLFFLPFLLFREGINGLSTFLEVLQRQSGVYELTTRGFSIDKIINSIVFIIAKIANYDIPFESLVNLLHTGPKFNILAITAALSGFFVPKHWQKTLACCLTFILYQTQGIYILSFLAIPFLCMILEEKNISKKTILPYMALLFTQLLLPITEGADALTQLSIKYGRFQICMIILLVYLITEAIFAKSKQHSSRQLNIRAK